MFYLAILGNKNIKTNQARLRYTNHGPGLQKNYPKPLFYVSHVECSDYFLSN